MATTLGSPYRILYVSRTRKAALLDVYATVLKPDLSQAGFFPMTPLAGLFAGSYYYDYYSSTSDPSGSYFSLVVSPSENVNSIVRFELDVDDQTDADTLVIPPTNLVAYMVDTQMSAEISDSDDVWAYLRLDGMTVKMDDDDEIIGQLRADQLNINLNSDSVITSTEGI